MSGPQRGINPCQQSYGQIYEQSQQHNVQADLGWDVCQYQKENDTVSAKEDPNTPPAPQRMLLSSRNMIVMSLTTALSRTEFQSPACVLPD